ncbi:MAG: hypothetical protein ACREUA_04815, partial [Burkholderiales bacterium]
MGGHTADSSNSLLKAIFLGAALFAIPVLLIYLVVTYVLGMQAARVNMESPAMTEQAVAQRLKPVGEVTIFDP